VGECGESTPERRLRAIEALLEEATASRTGKKVRHRDLDHLAGSWSIPQVLVHKL
jgi:hypothetical protein